MYIYVLLGFVCGALMMRLREVAPQTKLVVDVL